MIFESLRKEYDILYDTKNRNILKAPIEFLKLKK